MDDYELHIYVGTKIEQFFRNYKLQGNRSYVWDGEVK